MLSLYKRTLSVVAVYIFIRLIYQYYSTVPQTGVAIQVPEAIDISVHGKTEDNEYRCHYLEDNSFLSEVTEITKFPLNSIFFIDTSCSALTSRKACSIESAAKAHPNRQVIVLSTSPMNPKNTIVKKLLLLHNISFLRIHLENYAEGTPLDGKFRKNPLTFEDLNMDLSDVLKFLTLYKYSGIYLSMDVIVARSFDKLLKNWIVKENPATMSSDMFAFSDNFNGRAMAHVALNVIVNNLAMMEGVFLYRFDNGFVMKQFVSMWCGVTDILYLNSSNCQELEVGLPDNFFPIPFRTRQDYFKPGALDHWTKLKNREIYTYQMWESYTKNYPVGKDSLYTTLAKIYCPMTYNFYGNTFGRQ